MRIVLAITFAAFAAPLLAQTAETTAVPRKACPFVAAAKQMNRLEKTPDVVITNDMLEELGRGAHIMTTTNDRPFGVGSRVPMKLPPKNEAYERSLIAEKEAAARKKK
jgi:hypothetical protein